MKKEIKSNFKFHFKSKWQKGKAFIVKWPNWASLQITTLNNLIPHLINFPLSYPFKVQPCCGPMLTFNIKSVNVVFTQQKPCNNHETLKLYYTYPGFPVYTILNVNKAKLALSQGSRVP